MKAEISLILTPAGEPLMVTVQHSVLRLHRISNTVHPHLYNTQHTVHTTTVPLHHPTQYTIRIHRQAQTQSTKYRKVKFVISNHYHLHSEEWAPFGMNQRRKSIHE